MKKFAVYVAGVYYGETFAESLDKASEQVERHPKLKGQWPVTVTEVEIDRMDKLIRELYEADFDSYEEFKAAVLQLMEEDEG